MKIVCAWCFREIREVEPLHDRSLSHGICTECFDLLLTRNRLPKSKYFEAQPPHGISPPAGSQVDPARAKSD